MDAATETPPDPPPADKPGPARRWLAAVLAVAVLTGVGYGGWLVYQHRQIDAGAVAARAAAENYVLELTNFDSRGDTVTVENNLSNLIDLATGEYQQMYARSQAKLHELTVEKKAAGRGILVDSAIKSATADKVVVVLLVDQSVTNIDEPDPQLDRSRIRMTMNKVDGQWRVGYLEAL